MLTRFKPGKSIVVLITSAFLNVHSLVCLAQLHEDFGDGDFTSNPAWTSDTVRFTINPSMQLQLNAAAAGSSYLSTAVNLASLDSLEWEFFIKLGFPPSSQNYA